MRAIAGVADRAASAHGNGARPACATVATSSRTGPVTPLDRIQAIRQSHNDGAMDLSIVIPSYNEERRLCEQLDALSRENWPEHQWEVVVVDNRSTDRTADVARSFVDRIPSLRIVNASARAGLSYARNTGITAARSERIAICDADDVIAPGWVAAMGCALAEHRFVTGLLEVDLLNPRWLADTRGRRFEAGPMLFNGLFPLASGGNLGLHRNLWRELGGFSEHVVGAEDIHFSMLAWFAGESLHFEPRAVLHYRYRDDARALWQQGRGYGRARVTVCKELRSRGVKTSRFAGWRSWLWLIVRIPTLRAHRGRVAWTWVAGNRVGHLEGSIRSRSLYI